MKKEFLEIIKTRHSVRHFSDKKVDEEMIQEILACGNAAPSANGVYPREIKVYEDREILNLLAETQTWSSFIKDATACLVVVGYPGRSEYWVEDCSVASENVLLAAHALGLGSCWVAVKNMNHGDTTASEYVKETLSLPEDCEVLCLLPVGYKEEKR